MPGNRFLRPRCAEKHSHEHILSLNVRVRRQLVYDFLNTFPARAGTVHKYIPCPSRQSAKIDIFVGLSNLGSITWVVKRLEAAYFNIKQGYVMQEMQNKPSETRCRH